MARKRVVSRTFKITTCDVLCMDLIGKESVQIKCSVAGHYKEGDEKLLKAVQKAADTDVLKAVAIISATQSEEKRSMDENKFIQLSTVVSTDETEENEETEN